MSRDHPMNRATDLVQHAQNVPTDTDPTHPHTPIGRRPKTTPRASGGAAYATADHLTSLGDYLKGLTQLTAETGWCAPNMIVSFGFGEVEEETIIVGIRYISGAYHAEIR